MKTEVESPHGGVLTNIWLFVRYTRQDFLSIKHRAVVELHTGTIKISSRQINRGVCYQSAEINSLTPEFSIGLIL